MASKQNTAEGATTGVEITTSNQGASGDVLSPVKTGSASIQAVTANAIHGTKSYQLIAGSAESCYVLFNESGLAGAGLRAYFRIASAPSGNRNLLVFYGVRSTGSNGTIAAVAIRTDGRLFITNGPGTGVYTTPVGTALTFPAVFAVDLAINPGGATGGSCRFQLFNSAGATTPVDVMTELTGGDFGTSIASSRIGMSASEAVALTVLVDSVKRVDSYSLVGYQGSNTPPVVNASAPTTVPVGSAFTISCSPTDADGTIASVTVAQTAGPTLALSGSGNTRTATPSVPGTYDYTWTVTDNDGGVTTGVSRAYATAATVTPSGVVSNAGAWTASSGTLDTALADASDATYVQGPDNPASGQVFEVGMPPMGSGSVVLNYRFSVTATTPARTFTVGVYMNGTLVTGATKTETPSSTGVVAGSFTLDTGMNSAFSDHRVWSVRITEN